MYKLSNMHTVSLHWNFRLCDFISRPCDIILICVCVLGDWMFCVTNNLRDRQCIVEVSYLKVGQQHTVKNVLEAEEKY